MVIIMIVMEKSHIRNMTPFIKNDVGLLLGMDYKFSGNLSLEY